MTNKTRVQMSIFYWFRKHNFHLMLVGTPLCLSRPEVRSYSSSLNVKKALMRWYYKILSPPVSVAPNELQIWMLNKFVKWTVSRSRKWFRWAKSISVNYLRLIHVQQSYAIPTKPKKYVMNSQHTVSNWPFPPTSIQAF